MKALKFSRDGKRGNLAFAEIPRPKIGSVELLVQIHKVSEARAASALPILHIARSSAALSVAAALLLSGCHQAQTDPRQLPPLVRVAQVEAPVASERAFTGVVTARVQSELGFRVGGKLVERLVDNGQTVKRGQALMRVDVADLQLDIKARQAAVEAARARAEQAAADEQRNRGLVEYQAISVLAYEQSKSAALATAAELNAAEAQSKLASRAASYSVLRADADGIVVDTLAEPGQVIAAGQTVIRLAHDGAREATVDLPETMRPALGSLAKAWLYGDEQPPVSAHLRQLAGSANPITRTYEARYVLDAGAANAPLGATVSIRIADAHAPAAAQVPLSAIGDNGQGPGVWIVKPQGQQEAQEAQEAVVSWRPVTIARLDDENASLAAGLDPGDRYIVMGAHLLHAGDRVRIGTGLTASTAKAPAK